MVKLKYQINKKKCTLCKICMTECPTSTIKEIEGFLEINPRNCIKCGHCGAVCPENAISCDGEELPEFSDPGFKEEEVFQFLTGKRSVRQYKKKEISEEIIKKILEVGALTATASNAQDVKASVFRGEEVSRLSRDLCHQILQFLKKINHLPGRIIVTLAGYKRYASKKKMGGFLYKLTEGYVGKADPLFFEAPVVIHLSYPKKNKRFGRTDAVLAGENMMLYANSFGIGSCMIGFAEITAKKRNGRKALRTPKGHTTGLIFTLGYTKPKYLRLPKRFPL